MNIGHYVSRREVVAINVIMIIYELATVTARSI